MLESMISSNIINDWQPHPILLSVAATKTIIAPSGSQPVSWTRVQAPAIFDEQRCLRLLDHAHFPTHYFETSFHLARPVSSVMIDPVPIATLATRPARLMYSGNVVP